MAIGSLKADLGATGDLDEASALAEMEALEAADREPPATSTNAKVGARIVVRFATVGATT